MRILQLVPAFSEPYGGPVPAVRLISKELAKRHEVTVYTTTALDSKHDSDRREERVDGYRVVYFGRTLKSLCYSGVFGQLNLSPDMMKAVKQDLKRFDIVHVHSWQQFPDILVHHYATKYAAPYVLQAHGSIPRARVHGITRKKLRWTYDVLFGCRVLRDASKVVALSQAEAEQYRRVGVPHKKIVLVPNGIDLSEYADLPSKGAFKKKFGVGENKKIMLYLGRIHKTKGIDILINAHAHLTKKANSDDLILAIAGPDDGYLAEAMSLVESSGTFGSVLFTGSLDNKGKLEAMIDASLFVTPSFYGFPMAFLEACAVGIPIITTTLGDTLEWINGSVGYVTSPTYRDVAKAAQIVLSDVELAQKFTRNCREIARTVFSAEKVVGRLECLYKEVVCTR